MKRLCILTAALLMLLWLAAAPLSAALAAGDNLVENGGFETVAADGLPQGWYTSAYRTQEGFSRFTVTDEKAHSGRYSARVENANPNDARFVCVVPVEPSSMYRVTGYIWVESMQEGGNGANLAVEGVYANSTPLFSTGGQWQAVEWYGETGETQRDVQLSVRVGGYSAESQGVAYFDDIAVEKVDTVPTGVIPTLWYAPAAVAAQEDEPAAETAAFRIGVGWFLLIAAAFVLLAVLAGKALLGGGEDGRLGAATGQAKSARPLTAAFLLVLGAALLLRLYLAGKVPGYQVDMGCFSAWSLRMADVGPWGFYAEGYFCDYPPGYMLLLWPVGLILKAVGYSDTSGVWLLVKAIPILCDMAVATLLYAYARKRLPQAAAVFLGLFFALNPAALVNGAAWGQVDSVLALLLGFAAITAMEGRWRAALPLFMGAVLVKPQALLFAPVGVVWLLSCLWRTEPAARRVAWRAVLHGLLLALGCAAAVALPFSFGQKDPLWLVSLYGDTLASYNYATLNTANLLYVLGGNWSPLAGDNAVTLPRLIPAITGLALLALGAWAGGLFQNVNAFWDAMRKLPARLFSRREEGGGRAAALSLLCLLFGLAFSVSAFFPVTFAVYGGMWMAFAYLFPLAGLWADRSADALPFYMALMLLMVYVLGVKIHERYLYAALLLLPLGYARTRDRRLLWLCAGLSATTFINVAIVLNNSLLYGSAMGHLNLDTLWLNSALSVANVLLCLLGGYIAVTGLAPSPQLAPTRPRERFDNTCYRGPLLSPPDARLHMARREWLVVGAVTALYAALAFFNLGSTVAPQTAWVSTSAAEQAVFELDQAQSFKLLYYAGVSYSDFSVSVSDDGVTWSDPYPCQMREGLCYRWNYAVTTTDLGDGAVNYNDGSEQNILWLHGKYLRVNAESAGLNLWEIVLRNQDGERIPLTLAGHTGAKDVLSTPKPPENLIDEQTTLVGEPGWFNGTYFDEIYHARTAYEHLHGIAPYETTHPPLGKLMIAAGIALFGMTPFGWRFAGALVGVMMLPAIYLLAKQLFRRRGAATFAMLLLGLDLMHFTQTRIATIDSFPVLFIILATLCMARYLMADAYAVPEAATEQTRPRVFTRPFVRSLLPLLLSGLFMGLGIASKWIGLYAAVGLAALLGIAVYRQLRTGYVAFDMDLTAELTPMQKLRVQWARELTLKRLLVTGLCCVLFFIAVPAFIYYVSYIPYLAPSGPVTLERIIKAQQGMLAYHSTPGLGMDHPFNSPWWQWPLILKPMWFCVDKFEPAGYASTIMCMGNPVVFFGGALCMVAAFGFLTGKYVRVKGGLRPVQGDGNLALPILAVSFLAQYLPWVLVPRSMFIYHYFASVPFLILATAAVPLLAADIKRKRMAVTLFAIPMAGYYGELLVALLLHTRAVSATDGLLAAAMLLVLTMLLLASPKRNRWPMAAYVALAAVFFALFYPYASGLVTPTGWLDWLKWFPKIYY